MRRRLFSILWLTLASALSFAQGISYLRINEIMVANVDRIVDPSWNYGSWIEIYNSSSSEQNLKGMYLSNDADNLTKIHFLDDFPVAPKGFAVLWLGHKDVIFPNQIDLKLDCDGGSLYLANSSGVLVHAVNYPPAISRCSYARERDGSTAWNFTSTPTPGASNNERTYTANRLSPPEVSLPSQIFSRSVEFTVDIPEGCTLRYTTDGSTPTLENGEVSETGTFSAVLTTVYRFALFREGWLDSPVVTRSFIRKDKNFNIPVISVVTDPDNLYSDQMGVFVKGTNGRRGKGTGEYCNWNQNWDRPVNFEFFLNTGECVLNMESELSRCGGHSKGFTPMSFKIKASKEYEGQNYLPYQFFPDEPYLKHKMLQFRCGGNDYTYRFLDASLQSIVRTSGIDIDLQNYVPVCHYINGKYMGTINMREPNNKQNIYANFGLDDDEIDMFDIDCDSCYIQMCGTRDAWQHLYNLATGTTSDAAWEEIKNLVDVDEICNYIAVQFYLGNTDWPQNNCKGWRPIADDGKFRFVLFDVDFAFSTTDMIATFQNRQWYTFCRLYDVPYEHFTREVELVPIFQGLLRYDEFRRHFIDAFCIVAGSVFDPPRCNDVVNRALSIATPMQIKSCGYTGRNNDPTPKAREVLNSINNRQEAVINALRSHSSYRLSSTRQQQILLRSNVSAARLSINGQTLTTGRFDGRLFPPVTLRAQAPRGYRFTGWRNNTAEGDIVGTDEELPMPTSTEKITLVACYERITDEDDPQAAPPVMVNEVSAGNSVYVNEYFKKNDWIELYNNTDHDIDLEGYYLTDNAKQPTKYRIDGLGLASTLIPAGGYKIIWCDNLPTESQLHANFKLGNEDNQYVILSSPDRQWADTLIYCAHEGGRSVGRFPDGGAKLYHMYRPSIERANAMNLYTTEWEPTEYPPIDPTSIDIAHSGSLSLRCQGDQLLLGSEDAREVDLTIHSLAGMLVMRQRVALSLGRQSVSLQPLAPGAYVARLTDAQGNRCSAKFVKQ